MRSNFKIHTGTKTVVALYARVSSERQAEERTVESQLAALHQHAKKQGYTVHEAHVFVDNGVSGTELIRPGLEALRDIAAEQLIDRVLVLCPDRLSRKQAHQLILAEEFSRHGIELEFVNYPASSSPEDQLFLQMQGAIAEYEREKIMERCRRGKIFKARNKDVCVLSSAPYGFTYIKKKEGGPAAYVINPQEAEIVRQIFQMYGVERLSMHAIACHLNEQRIPAPGGGMHWHRSAVYRVLTNPAATGKAAYKKTQIVPRKSAPLALFSRGLKARYPKSSKTRIALPPESWISIDVPRIVPVSLFKRVGEQLQENKRFAQRNNKRHEYLLTSLLQCEECGYALHGITTISRGKERSYYKCAGRDRYRFPDGVRCTAHYVPSAILDDLVWEQTKKLLKQPELVLEEYTERLAEKKSRRVSLEALMKIKKREERRIENERSRLIDLYQAGTILMSEVKLRCGEIDRRLKAVKDELAMLLKDSQQEQQQLLLVEQIHTFQEKLNHNLDKLPFADQKKVLQLLVNQITVNCSNASITVKHFVPITDCRQSENVLQLCPDRVVSGTVDP